MAKKKQSKAIIYDWNGCLLDDFCVAHESMNRILIANDKKPVAAGRYRSTFDMPLLQLYKNFGFEGFPPGGQEIYTEVVKEMAPKIALRDDAATFVKNAKKQGIRNVLVSNSPTKSILDKLQENKLDALFDEVIGIDHPKYGVAKNKSDNLAAYLAENKADKLAFVGDTGEEIAMAKRFNGLAVAMNGGYMSDHRLWMRDPHFVVEGFRGFSNVLSMTRFTQKKLVV